MAELEAQSGHPASCERKNEEPSPAVEEMEALIKAKDEVRALFIIGRWLICFRSKCFQSVFGSKI